MARHDTDAEIVEAVRSTIDDLFSRFLGQLTGPDEAVAFVETLQRRGVVLVTGTEAPQMPELAAPELHAGPFVTINVNVTATPDTVSEVVEQVVAQADALVVRR
ncbi:hypothetical protein NSA53_17285 [Cellulosimicrobium cellulans]|uniref:hypothetical protein n=1 Tax=Cellulosimicrobium cellulans TaxID=1710 RepID=UPI002149B012|nr:hypothetical protein [Cellulosimicrobium cellulans]